MVASLQSTSNGIKTKTESEKTSVKQSLGRRLAPYFLWQLAALLLVEGILALAGLGEEEIFKLDKHIGTVHMANKKVTWRKEGYARSYLYASGLREPAAKAKASGVYRVILLGDSQTEAMQVSLDKSFGKILERKLSARLGRPVEVLNFGVSGYSTVQELLLMRRQVFAYAPDLILLGYNARDIFENWAIPDAAIANVRPIALKLPKQKIVIDESAVGGWMKSPRGKFINSIEWLRTNSRIWGLFAAYESDMAGHNEIYKTVVNFFTNPVKTIKQLKLDIAQPDYCKKLIASGQQCLSQNLQAQATQWDFKKVLAETSAPAPAPAMEAKAEAAVLKALEPEIKLTASDRLFHDVIANTMNALLQEFKSDASSHHCKLAVIGLPSRATLFPIAGMNAATLGMNYEGELALVQKQCAQNQVPYIDAQKSALNYSPEQVEALFYTAHLNEAGQIYVATEIEQDVAKLVVNTDL